MRAKNGSGWSGFSTHLYFQTQGSAPPPPTLVSPGTGNGPGETIGTLTPTMRWNASQGATGHGQTFRNDGGGWTLIYDNDNVANTTSLVLPSGYLQAGKQYRWNMRAKNGSGWSGFSTHPAQDVGVTPCLTLVSPGTGNAPGETIGTLTPTMRWNASQGATGYGLYVSVALYGCGNPSTRTRTSWNTTSHQLPAGKLEPGKKYRWNMRAKNASGWSGVSTHLYFQTQGAPPPPPPPPPPEHTISGQVKTAGGSAISGVKLTATGIGSITTTGNGMYSITVPDGWSGTITPSKSGYSFTPSSRSHPNVKNDRSSQNFTGQTAPPPPPPGQAMIWPARDGNGQYTREVTRDHSERAWARQGQFHMTICGH
ncbi:MAG: hypothetical protein KIS87_04785 [Phycisphaeraceae bacterium]|nr:hypothetical protein [Phycisphaeraceae bacterium]